MHPISLSELIRYTEQHSDFYRRFWNRHGFNSEREFKSDSDLEKIPILTKEDLLATPTRERSILTSKDWYYFTAISSGTTNHPVVMFQPSFAVPPYFRFAQALGKKPISSVLVLRPSIYAAAFLGATIPEKHFPPGSIISLGDVANLSFSASLAKEIGADCMVARPSDAVRFAAALQEHAYALENITFLWITGEPLTSAAISTIRYLYPKAIVLYMYAMTEGPAAMGIKSSLCTALDAISPNSYHLNTQDFLFEVIDGLSVVTALHKIPTPLIRYKTTDCIVIKKHFQCSCGFPSGPIGIIGSRSGGNSYKIGGCTFRAEEVKRVLNTLPGFVTGDFALQIEQVEEKNNLVVTLHFTLSLVVSPTSILTEVIRETLQEEMHVSGTRSLGEAIQQGLVAPIEIDYDPTIKGSFIFPPREIMKPFQNGD